MLPPLRNARKWSKCPTPAASTGLSLRRLSVLCLAVQDVVALGVGALAFVAAVVAVAAAASYSPRLQAGSWNPPAVPVAPVVLLHC